MKSIKKLIMASLMLVLAFVGVVASTFAWFTMQNQVDVDDIQLNVGTAGFDLQVSFDDENYGYTLALPTLSEDFTFIPTTYQTTFKHLVLDTNSESPTYGQYIYEAISPLTYNATTEVWDGTVADTSYITFDLYFTSSEATPLLIKFDVTTFEAALTDSLGVANALSKGAFRVMFEEDGPETSLVNIFEPFYAAAYDNDENLFGTFGLGEFYKKDRGFIANQAFDNFLLRTEVDPFPYDFSTINLEEHYQLDTSEVTAYTSVNSQDAEAAVGDISGEFIHIATTGGSNVSTKVTVTIWLEGWDGDTDRKSVV